MRQIELTKNQVTNVCDCHYYLVKGHKWFAMWDKSKRQFVAARNASVKERLLGTSSKIYMHRIINNTPPEMQTDHINNDSLDNRCENLRTATASENQHNKSKQANSTSGYKGVVWHPRVKKWQARIKINGKRISLGYFDNKKDAARTRDEASIEYHGKFAKLNFPRG